MGGGFMIPMAEASSDQHMEADVNDADKGLCTRLHVHMTHPFRAVIVERLNAPPVEYAPLVGLAAEGCFLRLVSRPLAMMASSPLSLATGGNSVWLFQVTKAVKVKFLSGIMF